MRLGLASASLAVPSSRVFVSIEKNDKTKGQKEAGIFSEGECRETHVRCLAKNRGQR